MLAVRAEIEKRVLGPNPEDEQVDGIGQGNSASFPGKLGNQRFDEDPEGKPHATVEGENQKPPRKDIPAVKFLLCQEFSLCQRNDRRI